MNFCLVRARNSKRPKKCTYGHALSAMRWKRQMGLESVARVKRGLNDEAWRLIQRTALTWHTIKPVLVNQELKRLRDRGIHSRLTLELSSSQ